MYNLPNILTISRIVVIPVIFLSIYIDSTLWSILAGVLFVVASITDYLDGYIARARNQNSIFGRLLDPIADKLLVISALLIIVANRMVDNVSYIPIIIIMCREVLVSGLREFLAEFKVAMPVTRLAKWKTAFQMVAIAMILLQKIFIIGGAVGNIGEALLWVAGLLTFITGYQYFEKCLDYVWSIEGDKKNPVKAVENGVKQIAVKMQEKVKKAVKKAKKPSVKKNVAKVVKVAKAAKTLVAKNEDAPRGKGRPKKVVK